MKVAANELAVIDQLIETLVGDVRNLPTPPVVLTQINRVISDDRASAYDMAAILAEDPAMSAKVLKLSNSAFFGISSPVPTVKQAIVVLGLNEVRNVVLSAAVFTAFESRPQDCEYHENFWRHSLAVAAGSRMLVRTGKVRQLLEAETAFSAGLLHDIGKMVVLCYAPAEHHRIRRSQGEGLVPDSTVEAEVMGVDHSQIGAYLAQRWNLPTEIVNTIAFHHYPHVAEDRLLYPAVVGFADYLAHAAFDLSAPAPPSSSSCAESMNRLGLTEDDISDLKCRLIEEYAKSETFLRMALG